MHACVRQRLRNNERQFHSGPNHTSEVVRQVLAELFTGELCGFKEACSSLAAMKGEPRRLGLLGRWFGQRRRSLQRRQT